MAAIEVDLKSLIEAWTELPTFYQHLNAKPGERFAWFIRSGDDDADCLDDEPGTEPDIVYFDVEIYESSAERLAIKSKAIRAGRGFGGVLDSGAYIDDVSISDQRDDYTPKANADSLPAYLAAFRFTVTGYQPPSI